MIENIITPRKKHRWRYLHHLLFIVTFGVAFFVRLKYIFVERIWPDEALYCWYAQRIHLIPSLTFSKEIIEFHPPLFSFLLSLGHFFFSPETACRIASFLFNLLGIVAIYILGRKISGYFLGIFAGITLAFNFLYLSQSSHILIDGPLMVFCLWLIIAMTKINMKSSIKDDVYVGLISSSIILLKWSGILVIPFLAAFYAVAFSENPVLHRFKKATVPLSMTLLVTLLLLLNNLIQLGQIWPDISALDGKYLIKPFWYYIVNLHNILIIPYLVPFFLYGLFVISNDKTKERKLLLVWFFVFLAGISFAPEKDLRYSLLILPASLLISAVGVEVSLNKIFKTPGRILIGQIVCIACIFLFCWQMYPRMDRFLESGGRQFSGFKEAGDWIKTNSTDNTQILAGSPRIIRYYSGINFQSFGGRIRELPRTQKDFESLIRNIGTPLIIEVDFWERTQPKWIYPLSENRIEYLTNLGFRMKKTVFRPVQNKSREVVWIFQRE